MSYKNNLIKNNIIQRTKLDHENKILQSHCKVNEYINKVIR